jgi:hypothetical protein
VQQAVSQLSNELIQTEIEDRTEFSSFGSKQSDMAKATLVLRDASLSVAGVPLVNNYTLFGDNLALAASPYRVKSSVALEIFQLFLEAVEGKEV